MLFLFFKKSERRPASKQWSLLLCLFFFLFQLVILSMASLTDRSETLYLWKTREKMVRYKNRHSGQNCGRRSLCPSSSTHSVTPRIQKEPRWILGGAGFHTSFHRAAQSWWEIVNYLDSSFRVCAASSGLWPAEGSDRVEWRDSPPTQQSLLNVSLPLADCSLI